MMNIIRLRLIQIYKNPAILILAVLTTLVFSALVSSIYLEVEQEQVLNVGVIDLDQTAFSENVMNNVDNHGMFNQIQVTEDEGISMLKANDIELMYVITKGASDRVDEGEYEGLILLYFIGDNYLSPLLGDVLVGEMFEEISMQAAMNLLDAAVMFQYDAEVIRADALAYSQILKQEIEPDKYVDVVFEDVQDNRVISEDVINTGLLYKQMLLGIILAFLGIYILFCGTSINRDYETAMVSHIQITKLNSVQVVLGHYISIVAGAMPIVVVFSVLNGIFDRGVSGFIEYFVVYLLYVLVASGVILVLLMILPSVSSYIVIGSAFVLLQGIISGSFFNIDLTVSGIKQMAHLTYAYHGLNQLMQVVTLQGLSEIADFVVFAIISVVASMLLAFFIHQYHMRTALSK